MKVKNEYVKINIGKNNFSFKNLILNKYLERLAKNQVKDVGTGYAPILNACYLRFDDKLIFDEESELHIKHFNKKCSGSIINKEYNNNIVSTTYKYNTDNIQSYLNKNITAIGFFEDGIDECLACINTYELGLTITDFFNFYIERKDTISFEGEFSSINPAFASSDIKEPLHLEPGIHYVNGIKVKIFLETMLYGDKVGASSYSTNDFPVNEEKLKDGIIEYALNILAEYRNGLVIPDYNVPKNGLVPLSLSWQRQYIWLQYRGYNYDTGDLLNNVFYYIKIPVKIIDKYRFSINFERSDK